MQIYFYFNNSLKSINLPDHAITIAHLKNNILRSYEFNYSNMKIYYIQNNCVLIPENDTKLNENIDYYLEVN